MAKKKRSSPALRAFRHDSGLKVTEFAEKLGIAVSTLISYENGARQIDGDFALKAERRVGIPRERLLPYLFIGFRRVA